MKKKQLLLTALAFAVCIIWGCKKELHSPVKTLAVSKSTPPDSSQYVVGAHGELILKSNFHIIEKGYKLTVQNQHVYKVEMASGKFVKDLGEFKHLYTYQKDNMPPVVSNLTSSPKGITRSLQNNKDALFGTSVGWVAAEEWQNTAASPINYFSTTCVVPPMPTTQSNQTFAFWIGLSPYSGGYNSIVQPILNYGQPPQSTAANTYQVFNYFFWIDAYGNNNAAMTTPVTVTPGNTIKFVISYTGTTSGSYDYVSDILDSNGTPITPTMYITVGNQYLNGNGPGNAAVPVVAQSNYADVVLEDRPISPYMTLRSEYPNALPNLSYVAMSNISLSTGNPGQYSYPASLSWNPLITPGGPQLGETEQVASQNNNNTTNPGQINLWYAPITPAISYTTPNVYSTSIAITPLSPTNTGSTPTSYSVSPALPAGLTLNTSTGVISGTPTTATSLTSYTISATNSSGTGTCVIQITVNNSTSYPVAFDISSGNAGITDFMLWVNGTNVSGPRGVSGTNPIVVNGWTNSGTTSTVLMQVTFGYMPVNATLYGNFAPINGVISGSNITFSGAGLASAGTVWVVLN